MKRYLLDTNHLGEALSRVSVVRDRIQQRHRQAVVFGTCGPVLCELLVGVVLRKDAAKTRRRLESLLQVVRIWPVDVAIADAITLLPGNQGDKGGRRKLAIEMAQKPKGHAADGPHGA